MLACWGPSHSSWRQAAGGERLRGHISRACRRTHNTVHTCSSAETAAGDSHSGSSSSSPPWVGWTPLRWPLLLGALAVPLLATAVRAPPLRPLSAAAQGLPQQAASISVTKTPPGAAAAAAIIAGGQQRRPSLRLAASVSVAAGDELIRAARQRSVADMLASQSATVLQRVLEANILFKLLALALASLPVIWAFGMCYCLATGYPLRLGLFKVYTVALRAPGARVTEEPNLPAAILMNSVFIMGIFTFAVVIGIVSEEIKGQLKGVRSGNFPVVCEHHTLVLNWNSQAPRLLRQMAADVHGCSRTLGRKVVVLSERSKEDVEEEVARVLQRSRLEVTARQGSPHFLKDLRGVSAARARTVIVLHPEGGEEAEVKKAATVLGLEAARSLCSTGFQHKQRVVVQSPQRSLAGGGEGGQASLLHALKSSVRAQRGSSMRLVEVNGNSNIVRLLAQAAVQPGVANAYQAILQSLPGAPDFHLTGCGQELAGKTFQEARRCWPNAVVCGVVSAANGRTRLNPADSLRLEFADRLILLAHRTRGDDELRPAPAAQHAQQVDLPALLQQLRVAAPPQPTPKRIVVLGWSGDPTDLVAAVLEFAPPGSEVVVLGREPPAGLAPGAARFVRSRLLDRGAYIEAGVADCDALILGSLSVKDTKLADARLLTSLLLTVDIVSARGDVARRPHVVACVQHTDSMQTARRVLRELAGGAPMTSELLQPDLLATGILLGVAHEPSLAPAMSELIDSSEGNELYLRRPEVYGLSSRTPASFADVAELARLRGETALGYITVEGHLVLAPDIADQPRFGRGSRVVVLAKN